jgi:hypothetical protein
MPCPIKAESERMIKQEQKQQASLNARSEKIQKSAGPTI